MMSVYPIRVLVTPAGIVSPTVPAPTQAPKRGSLGRVPGVGTGYRLHMKPHVDRSDQSAATSDAPATGTRSTDARVSDEHVSNERAPDPVREYPGTGIMWSGIALIVLLTLLVVLAFQNTQAVDFDFLWFDTLVSLSLILAITAGIAVVATEAVGFVWRHRRRKLRRERDELKRLRSGAH